VVDFGGVAFLVETVKMCSVVPYTATERCSMVCLIHILM